MRTDLLWEPAEAGQWGVQLFGVRWDGLGGPHAHKSTWPFLKKDGLIRAVLGLLEVGGGVRVGIHRTTRKLGN